MAGYPVVFESQPGDDPAFDLKKTLAPAKYTRISGNGSVKGSPGTPGYAIGIICISGTGTLSCRLWNNSSAAGDQIFPQKTLVIGDVVMFPAPIECPLGIFADVTGTSPIFNVLYR